MWKTADHLRRQCKSHWGPLAGLVSGLMFVLVQLTTVHVGRLLRRFRELEMVDIRSNEVVFLGNVRLLEEIARPMQDLVDE